MGNYSKQRIGKYASHKMCCVAQGIVDTDKLSQYGIENLECRINNDFIATVFLELLQCSDYRNVWGHIEEGQMTVTVPTPGSPVSIESLNIVHSTDPTQTIRMIPDNSTFTADTMPGVLNELVDKINLYQDPDWTSMRINAENDGGYLRLIFENDLDVWPNYYMSFSLTNITISSASPKVIENLRYLDEGDTDEFACLNDTQICDIVEWLDLHCEKCEKDFSVKAITETLS